MIQRDIFAILEKELEKDKITVITGARQIGKSTAMKVIYETLTRPAHFITFDAISIKNLFEENPDLFIEQHIKPYEVIFIDEFQYAKEGGKILKYIFDTTKKKMFISGSSKPEIAIQSLQYLVGRVSLIEMQPLSFKEFVSFKSPEKKILLEKKRTMNDLSQLQSEFQEFLLFGGYPDVVKEPNFEEKKKILQDILQVYLLKEIKDIMGYKNSHEFEKLLKTIATQNGRLHKHSTLSNTLGISWVKAQEYIHILTKTELVNTVQPFYTNKSKELIKTPKVYFNDIGLLNALLNNFSPLQERIDKGELLETFISQELSKRGYKAKFWSRQLSEVDFILEKDAKLIAIECKSHTAKLPLSLKTFMQEYTVSKAIVFNLKEDKVHTQIQTPTESTHYCNVSSILFF